MVKRKHSSEGRRKHLNTTFNEVYKLSGMTPSDLVEIGLKQQTPFIDECVVKTTPLADRYITKLYYDYYDYLKEKTYMQSHKPFIRQRPLPMHTPLRIPSRTTGVGGMTSRCFLMT